jgi:hypothetical protein
MKFRKSQLVSIAIRYGLIAGAIITLLMVIFYYMGQHPLLVSPYLDFRIVLFGVFIFFSLKEFREVHQNGILFFWQGMVGSYILIFVSMIIASFGIIVFGQVDPEFVALFIRSRLEYLNSFPQDEIDKIGKEVFERNLKAIPGTNAMMMAQAYFMQGIVIGLFISVILSAILRKQPKTL